MNDTMRKIGARMMAFRVLMKKLEDQGFRSGGWDSKTDKTAIIDTRMPEHEIRIAGYIDRDLNIEWRDGYRRADLG